MPHCILEYSCNVVEQIDSNIVFKEIHQTLVDTGLFQLNNIKSRAIIYNDFYIGDGDEMRGFAALTVGIFSGRDIETRKMITNKCLKVLEHYFPESLKKLKFDITVQINELDKESYAKLHS